MAARGQKGKDAISKVILDMFEGSFKNDKEIRIPVIENGETIEIKVTLTAAKDTIGGNAPTSNNVDTPTSFGLEPTEEEKLKLKELLASL